MTADQKLAMITDAIDRGKTVYFGTYTRLTKITPKTWKRWADNGHTLLKVSGKSLFMARGRQFDCVDYCNIKIQ